MKYSILSYSSFFQIHSIKVQLWRLTPILALSLALISCTNLGPRVLPENRQAFNAALQQSDSQQLLLNIVRMRYDDMPYFLSVNSVTSQMEFAANAGGAVQYTNESLPKLITRFYGADANVAVTERPTINYIPLQGEQYTKQLLTPIKLETMYLLLESGWSLSRLFRVIAQSVGAFDNAPSAARPSTRHVPKFKDFVSLTHAVRNMEVDEVVHLESSPYKKGFGIDIVIEPGKKTPAVIKVLKKMRTKGLPNRIKIVQERVDSHSANIFSIQTRSFIGILFYLSKSVDVSDDDIKKGWAVVPHYHNGKPFDWREVTKGMMSIHSSAQYPNSAAVVVYYRHRWYYIDDSDNDSKQTMILLLQLYSLRAGEVKGVAPILTLPI